MLLENKNAIVCGVGGAIGGAVARLRTREQGSTLPDERLQNLIGARMKIADKTVLVTGTNRGIGQALVEEARKL